MNISKEDSFFLSDEKHIKDTMNKIMFCEKQEISGAREDKWKD